MNLVTCACTEGKRKGADARQKAALAFVFKAFISGRILQGSKLQLLGTSNIISSPSLDVILASSSLSRFHSKRPVSFATSSF